MSHCYRCRYRVTIGHGPLRSVALNSLYMSFWVLEASFFVLEKYSIVLHDLLQNHFDAISFIVGLVYGNFYGLLKFDLLNVLR